MVYTIPDTIPNEKGKNLKPAVSMVPLERIELSASPLPRVLKNLNYLISKDIFLGKPKNVTRTSRFYTPLQSQIMFTRQPLNTVEEVGKQEPAMSVSPVMGVRARLMVADATYHPHPIPLEIAHQGRLLLERK